MRRGALEMEKIVVMVLVVLLVLVVMIFIGTQLTPNGDGALSRFLEQLGNLR